MRLIAFVAIAAVLGCGDRPCNQQIPYFETYLKNGIITSIK